MRVVGDTFEAESANLLLDEVTVFLLKSKVLFYLYHCIRLVAEGAEGGGGGRGRGGRTCNYINHQTHKKRDYRQTG